jgi:hypothetical protein
MFGVDLDVRMRVATDLKWTAITDLMEKSMTAICHSKTAGDYWAKEPLDATRGDATIRYASAFRIDAVI